MTSLRTKNATLAEEAASAVIVAVVALEAEVALVAEEAVAVVVSEIEAVSVEEVVTVVVVGALEVAEASTAML